MMSVTLSQSSATVSELHADDDVSTSIEEEKDHEKPLGSKG